MKDTDCIELLENCSKIILNISNYEINNIFKIICSLSRILKYSYVKILNLKSKEYNDKISQIEDILDNDRYKICVNDKNISIKKENLMLYPIILIIKYWELSNSKKSHLNLAFKIPTNNTNILVIFYKSDIYFEDLETISKYKIDAFINRSSYEDIIYCTICNDKKLHLVCCTQCVNNFCYKCLFSFEKKSCPYCKADIIYTEV